MTATTQENGRSTRTVELGSRPAPLTSWLSSMWEHRHVLGILTRKDFHVRYKRASLGILWAVAVPLIQATVLAIVFSKVVRVPTRGAYGPFVFSGVVAWSYFSLTTSTSVSSIVDGAGLTDKVWFPRALLAIVPCLANTISLGVSIAALVVIAPVLGAELTPWMLMLVPATLLLITFTVSLGLVLSALNVYFRDVKFLVSAAMLVWIYVTPVLYPQSTIGGIGRWLDFNPMTGIVNLFHMAVLGPSGAWERSVIVTLVVTAVLFVVGIEAQRRYDRLFVDLL